MAREAASVDVGLHGHAGELAQRTVDVNQFYRAVVLAAAPPRRVPPVAYDERHAGVRLEECVLAPRTVLAQLPTVVRSQ